MTHWRKLRIHQARRWVSFILSQDALQPVAKQPTNSWLGGELCNRLVHRFYNKKAARLENGQMIDRTSTSNRGNVKVSRADLREAQAALLEYLHSTRSLHFLDAEHISSHSPRFLQSLLETVGKSEHDHSGRSLDRFLRYNPINEFEPFFESIGLDPLEFVPQLPKGFTYLSDDACLLENYRVLVNYGVPYDKIGTIYKKAKEVFGYDHEYLVSKLEALEGLGLNRPAVIMAVASCPRLLIGDLHKDFGKILAKLKSLGLEHVWVERHYSLLNNVPLNWGHVHEVLSLVSELECTKKQLESLFSLHPEVVFDNSGTSAFSLIGFLIKFGSTKNDLCSVFSPFPEIKVQNFVWNLKCCYAFLEEIHMNLEDIGKIVRSHPKLLGLCSLKRSSTILSYLGASQKRICKIIEENPHVLKNWVLGAKVDRLPNAVKLSLQWKTEFLVSKGLAENSKSLKKALAVFRGNGLELQERFDCLVEAGFDQMDALKIIRSAPQILNQSKEAILTKIDFLVKDLGYPISKIAKSPSSLGYKTQRLKLRHLMYKWLHEHGVAGPDLAINSFVACSDKLFVIEYVNRHPEGPDVWKKLKQEIYNL